VAAASAEAIRAIAAAAVVEGGIQALQMQLAKDFIDRWANLAKQSTTMIVPADLANIGAIVGTALSIVKGGSQIPSAQPGSVPSTR